MIIVISAIEIALSHSKVNFAYVNFTLVISFSNQVSLIPEITSFTVETSSVAMDLRFLSTFSKPINCSSSIAEIQNALLSILFPASCVRYTTFTNLLAFRQDAFSKESILYIYVQSITSLRACILIKKKEYLGDKIFIM